MLILLVCHSFFVFMLPEACASYAYVSDCSAMRACLIQLTELCVATALAKLCVITVIVLLSAVIQ